MGPESAEGGEETVSGSRGRLTAGEVSVGEGWPLEASR